MVKCIRVASRLTSDAMAVVVVKDSGAVDVAVCVTVADAGVMVEVLVLTDQHETYYWRC